MVVKCVIHMHITAELKLLVYCYKTVLKCIFFCTTCQRTCGRGSTLGIGIENGPEREYVSYGGPESKKKCFISCS